ncbi:trypsin-like peptidase domain-containing protein [Streptomyces sp. BBFR102]|uniref:S1C family serine protease n=1 Tax=Streptomyces sp. BBFR102 TaxID=3448171 RepID=UPI003F52CAA5
MDKAKPTGTPDAAGAARAAAAAHSGTATSGGRDRTASGEAASTQGPPAGRPPRSADAAPERSGATCGRADSVTSSVATAAPSAACDGVPEDTPAPGSGAAAVTPYRAPEPSGPGRARSRAGGPVEAPAPTLPAQAGEGAASPEPAGTATPPGPGVSGAGGPTAPGPRAGACPDASVPAPADRARPLHAPDPYSTPPYGEPGPWAPAPPVQRPVPTPTPAHGTPVPPAHTAPAPDGVPPGQGGDWGRYDPWAVQGALVAQAGGGPGERRRERRAGRGRLLGAALALALVAGTVGGYAGMRLERHGGFGTVELEQASGETGERAPDSVAGIAARTLPGVVTLHVSGGEGGSLGTGFVLDGRGHILTNHHVVDSAQGGGSIRVTFNGGETARARLVGGDPGYDLAVVKVSGVSGLTPLPLGDSDEVRVGDPVVAIGAPFDLANTVTSGIISAKERPITAGGEKGDGTDVSYVDALQTDAPINPGNSGGPLVDARARVVGINSAIHAPGGSARQDEPAGSVGLGFAIPVNQAKRVAEELINDGRATHPVIGVTLDMGYEGEGAKVGGEAAGGGPAVTPGGPADQADIAPGEVITEVDGVPVASGEELIIKIRSHRPGDRLDLTVERDGESRRVTLELGSSDPS